MPAFARLRSFCRTLWRAGTLDRDLDAELRAYVEHRIEQRVSEGLRPEDARRLVLAEEGGLESVKERTRDARIGFGISILVQDVRYAWRTLRRAPAYSVVACLTLALGIGANIALFTVVRSVLWRPLPYPAPERLVSLEADVGGVRNAGFSSRELHELRMRSRTLTQVAIANGVDAHVDVDGEVERVAAASVSADLLPALGVAPALGRLFDGRDDAISGQVRSVVVSHTLWRRRFSANPDVIGRWIDVNNVPRQLIGVLPPGFEVFLPGSTGVQEETHVWFQTGIDFAREERGEGSIARLAEGADLSDARRELDDFARQFAAERPAGYQDGAVKFRAVRLRDSLTENVTSGLRALAIAVAFVLLVSCVNVANLTMARATGRVREIAVRRALGASRSRIVRQLMTESLLLSATSGGLGLLLGHWGVSLLDWLRPTHLPRQSQIGMDEAVVLFSIAVSCAAGVVFGILPALRFTASDAQSLRAGRADSPARSSRRIQRALVVSEIALSIVPLVAAGLMLRSFFNLVHAPIGFNPERVVTAWMPISFRRFPDIDSRWRIHVEALDRIRTIPGVEAVSAGSPPPYHQWQITRAYGRTGDGTPVARATQQTILPGYLRIVGTRLLSGRDVTAEDIVQKRPVVIVDARIASQLWPAGDAIGQRLALRSGERVRDLEVVGVTEPVRTREVRDHSMPHVFVPYHLFAIEMALVIKTDVPATALEPVLRDTLREVGTGRAVFDVWPLEKYVSTSIAAARFTMLVLVAFAAASMLLAGIGLYGTLTYLSSQRSREFGVRLALGATQRQILTLIAREAFVLTVAGAVLGMAGALATTRALRTLLYGVTPIDPVTIVAVGGMVSALSVLAAVRPAWLAARVDPTAALRAE